MYRNNLTLKTFSLIQEKESELLNMVVNKLEIITYIGFNMAAKLDWYQTSSHSMYNALKKPFHETWCQKGLIFSESQLLGCLKIVQDP